MGAIYYNLTVDVAIPTLQAGAHHQDWLILALGVVLELF